MVISPTEIFILILMGLVPILVIGGGIWGLVRFSQRQRQLETRVQALEKGHNPLDQKIANKSRFVWYCDFYHAFVRIPLQSVAY